MCLKIKKEPIDLWKRKQNCSTNNFQFSWIPMHHQRPIPIRAMPMQTLINIILCNRWSNLLKISNFNKMCLFIHASHQLCYMFIQEQLMVWTLRFELFQEIVPMLTYVTLIKCGNFRFTIKIVFFCLLRFLHELKFVLLNNTGVETYWR